MLGQGGFFIPTNSTAVQHFLTCYGVALDEVILLYLTNTFLGTISGDGADASFAVFCGPTTWIPVRL